MYQIAAPSSRNAAVRFREVMSILVSMNTGENHYIELFFLFFFYFYENDIHKQRQDTKNKKLTITSCQKYLGATGKKVNEKY